jgi:hypothetical protein
MSQRAGDFGSQMMFARSQYEQNAKRKNIVVPKGTTFKNVKIRDSYDHKSGTHYLSTLGVKDKKRSTYDEGDRAFKESDFKVTNLSQAGNNFFNVQNFLIVKNNGFDVSENAIVDIELNKDVTFSVFDEPYIDPVFNNGGFPPVATNNNQTSKGTTNFDYGNVNFDYGTVLCNNGSRDITNGKNAPCSGIGGGVATNQNRQSQNQQVSFLEKNQKLILTFFVGIVLYIGYKKFIK